jgi:hypothetical protein
MDRQRSELAFFRNAPNNVGEPGSSVSIVSVCLRARRPGDQDSIPCRGERNFSLASSVQTGSEAHPASCAVGTGGPFPGAEARPGRDADTHPHLVPRSRMSRRYTSSPSSAFMACNGTALALT